ncbi:MAG: hypothetical protein LUD22_03915 [Coprobacillus sp.]|nr:hypothetical protein [Coprobacillus sp.]
MVSIKKSNNKHVKRVSVLLASVFVFLAASCEFTIPEIGKTEIIPDDAPETSESTDSSSGSGAYAPTFTLSDEGGEWTSDADLDIFYNDTFGSNMIAPGLSGSYTFNLLNTSEDEINFSIHLSEDNELGIAMVYKLDREGEPLVSEWSRPDDFEVLDETLEAYSSTTLTLYWYWDPDVNDEADTRAATEGMTYSLSITIDAYIARFDDD